MGYRHELPQWGTGPGSYITSKKGSADPHGPPSGSAYICAVTDVSDERRM